MDQLPLISTVYRVIDTEWTGCDPITAGVCELAWVDVDAGGTEHGRFHRLVNPGREIEPGASAVHHLTDEDVRQEPPLTAWLDYMIAPVFVAHSAANDAQILGLASALWIDTERLAKHLWPGIRSYGVQEIRYTLGLRPDVPKRAASHNALYDAIVTAAVFAAAMRKIHTKWPAITTVQQLVEEIAKPVLLEVIPFKSANGQRFEHAETSHLDWIVSTGAGGMDCVHTAAHWLKERFKNRPFDSDFDEDTH